MDNVTRVGIDLAKKVFRVTALDADGAVVERKRLRRSGLQSYLALLPQGCVVVMEACGSAHHWARQASRLGHRAVLMYPRFVLPYVSLCKNDSTTHQFAATLNPQHQPLDEDGVHSPAAACAPHDRGRTDHASCAHQSARSRSAAGRTHTKFGSVDRCSGLATPACGCVSTGESMTNSVSATRCCALPEPRQPALRPAAPGHATESNRISIRP